MSEIIFFSLSLLLLLLFGSQVGLVEIISLIIIIVLVVIQILGGGDRVITK